MISFLLIISIGFIYCLMVLFFIIGWKNIIEFKKGDFSAETFVSVIIPVRNEEANIENLLNDILNQDYPKEFYEVIVVNDFSNDATISVLNRFSENYSNLIILSLPGNYSGKKDAIRFGINHAKGKLIVSTDGDCRMGSQWLSTIASFYEINKPKMIIAPVIYNEGKNVFEKLQLLEYLSLIGSGAGASGIGHPVMCNGANLAYEKDEYLKFQDSMNSKYSSGDDMFLLHNLKTENRKQILFLKSKEAMVVTNPATNLKSFIHQRIRWTSKSTGYKDTDSILIAIIVLLTNLTLLLTLVFSFFDIHFFYCFCILFFAKSLTDFIFLFEITRFFRQQWLMWLFLPMQFLYFFYVSFVGIFGSLIKPVWKGRIIK